MEAGSLEALGIFGPEERSYEWLLQHAHSTALDVARGLRISQKRAQGLLDAIEARGLVTHTLERPRRYIPAPPDLALQVLLGQQNEALQRTQERIRELQTIASVASLAGSTQPVVELITSRDAERQIFEQVEKGAQQEVVTLVRAPVRITRIDPLEEAGRPRQREAQARGVHYRSIFDAELLGSPGMAEYVRADMEAGEEIRVISHLPFKLFLVDRRLALVPLNLDQAEGPALLVRSSALLDALYALFEFFWHRAAPFAQIRADSQISHGAYSAVSSKTEELVSLMAAGLSDKAIAHQLRISVRTLRRHAAELMGHLEARTRFQAGWAAAQRASPNAKTNRASKQKYPRR